MGNSRNNATTKPYTLRLHEMQLADSQAKLESLAKSKPPLDGIHLQIANILDQVGNLHALIDTVQNDKSFSQYLPEFKNIEKELEINYANLLANIKKVLSQFNQDDQRKVKSIFIDVINNFTESKRALNDALATLEKNEAKKHAPSSQTIIMNKLHEADLNENGQKMVNELTTALRDRFERITISTPPGKTKISIEGDDLKAHAMLAALRDIGINGKLEFSQTLKQTRPIPVVVIENDKLNNLNAAQLKIIKANLKLHYANDNFKKGEEIFAKKIHTVLEIIAAANYYFTAQKNGHLNAANKYNEFLNRGNEWRAFIDSSEADPKLRQENINIMMEYYQQAEHLKPGCTKAIANSFSRQAESIHLQAKIAIAQGRHDLSILYAERAIRYFDRAKTLGNKTTDQPVLECRLISASSSLQQNNISQAITAFDAALEMKNSDKQKMVPADTIKKFQSQLHDKGMILAKNESTRMLGAQCFSKCMALEAVTKINLIQKSDRKRIGELLYIVGAELELTGKKTEAFNYYKQAVTLGHLKAHTNAGFNYLQNSELLTNRQTGIKLLTKSADSGHARGQYYLADAYHHNNYSKDLTKAKHYYELLIKNPEPVSSNPKQNAEVKQQAKEIVAQLNQIPAITKQVAAAFHATPKFETRDTVQHTKKDAKHGQITLDFNDHREYEIANKLLAKHVVDRGYKSVTLTWSPELAATLSDKKLAQRVHEAAAEMDSKVVHRSHK